MKYGSADFDPLVVIVHPLIDRWKSSAAARHRRADAASPLTSARSAPASNTAISAAMVEGEKPDCSSHRSEPNDGPRARMKLAAGLMCCSNSVGSVRPS